MTVACHGRDSCVEFGNCCLKTLQVAMLLIHIRDSCFTLSPFSQHLVLWPVGTICYSGGKEARTTWSPIIDQAQRLKLRKPGRRISTCHCCNDKKVIVLLRLSNNCEIILVEFALLWCFPRWRSSEIIHKQEKRIHIQAADNCGTPCVFCSASMAARKSRGSLGSITCQETGNFVNKLHGRSQVCSMCKSHLTDFWAQVPPSNESR